MRKVNASNKAMALIAVIFATMFFNLAFVDVSSNENVDVLEVADIVELCLPSICTFVDKNENVIGTGVIVDSTGILITNIHVLECCEQGDLMVENSEGERLDILGIIDYSIENDWATLKVERYDFKDKPLPHSIIGNSSGIRLGESCIAIGNPYGLRLTVTEGIVSCLERKIDVLKAMAIQHSAYGAGGSSGGGLYDRSGRLIGINCAGMGGESAYCFAIPIDKINLDQGEQKFIPYDDYCKFLIARVESNNFFADWGYISELSFDAFQHNEQFIDAKLLYAESRLYLDDPQACLEICEDIIALEPASEKALFLKGYAYVDLNKIDQAEAICSLLYAMGANDEADYLKYEIELAQIYNYSVENN